MSTFDEMLKTLTKAIKQANRTKTQAYDVAATVTRVEGDIAWVHIPGGVQETPVKLTVAAKPGQTVQVRVSGGRAFLVGNASAPPTDDARAIVADKRAQAADQIATQAQETAGSAAQAAVEAWEHADDAADAAESAKNSLKSVVQGATTVEKAVSVMQTALEAVVDYDPDTDTTQEYFWHDANGAHVLGNTSGFRNDITSTGMDIVEVDTEESVASFGASGATIGKGDSERLEIGSDSLAAYNSNSVPFFVVDYDGGTTSHTQVTRKSISFSSKNYSLKTMNAFPSLTPTYLLSTGTVNLQEYDGARVDFYGTGNPSELPFYIRNSTTASYRLSVKSTDLIRLKPEQAYSSSSAAAWGLAPNINPIRVGTTATFTSMSRVAFDVIGSSGDSLSIVYISIKTDYDATTQKVTMSLYASQSNYLAARYFLQHRVTVTAQKTVTTTAPAFTLGTNGSDTTGSWSTRIGRGLISKYESQVSVGKYNVNSQSNAFEIGSGSSDSSRKNAFEVDWAGNLHTSGLIQDGDGNWLNQKANSADVYTTTEVDNLIAKAFEPQVYPFILPSSLECSGFRIVRCGPIVSVSVLNVTKAAVGSNNIGTLPEGWRPIVAQSCVLVGPTGATPTANNLSLRLTVSSEGVVDIYNYRSTAISGNTNQGGSLTYIAEQ